MDKTPEINGINKDSINDIIQLTKMIVGLIGLIIYVVHGAHIGGVELKDATDLSGPAGLGFIGHGLYKQFIG